MNKKVSVLWLPVGHPDVILWLPVGHPDIPLWLPVGHPDVLQWLPVGDPDVGHVGPGHIVAGHPLPGVVRAQPVLLHLYNK